MDSDGKKSADVEKSTGGLYYSVATRESGRVDIVAINDADYWRNKYDELLKHLEHQQSYCRYLEQQVFGGKVF